MEILYKETPPVYSYLGRTLSVLTNLQEKGGPNFMSDGGSRMRVQQIDTESAEPPSLASSL